MLSSVLLPNIVTDPSSEIVTVVLYKMSEIDTKKNKVSMMQLKSQSGTRSQVGFEAKSMSRLKVRRQSFGFSGVPGIRPVERTSQVPT